MSDEVQAAYDRGVADERERCAGIAESEALTGDIPYEWTVRETLLVHQAVQATASRIAAAIRRGPETAGKRK